jgi:excisionase family DNA binding protein
LHNTSVDAFVRALNPKRQTLKPDVRTEEDSVTGLGDKSDVARLCKVSNRQVEIWVRQRRIPFIRMGHRLLRFDLAAVKAAIKSWSTPEIN